MFKTIRMFAGAAALGLTVAACGGDTTDDIYTDPALETAPAPAPATTEPGLYDPAQPVDTLGMPADTMWADTLGGTPQP
jgi:hypothetical protein